MNIGPGQFGDDRDRVRDAADIVRVVGQHVSLKPKGREYVGLCPFHNDHKPSMCVVPAKGIFHCFVCGTGGDVFSFVQKYLKMEFREALEYLAEQFNVQLTPRSAPAPTTDGSSSRKELLDANRLALEFFRTILRHAEHGAAARAAIQKRGISEDMVEKFALGASPDRWDGLVLTAQKVNFPLRTLAEAGLVKRREQSDGLYDALRNRLIFPIFDKVGRVIAFGGRKLRDEDEPKYLNSPETRLFDKSATLYGLHLASRSIMAERTAIITEGYTDVIACHQAGFTNAVATLGTALTPQHASALQLVCDRVVLLFDGDDAGQKAADRAVEVFFGARLDVAIAALSRFTDAKDPDELLKRPDGAEVFRKVLAGATDILQYRYQRLRARTRDAGLSALERATQEELERLAELGINELAPHRRALVLQQLSRITGLESPTLVGLIPAGRRPQRAVRGGTQEQDAPAERIGTRHLSAAEHLLGCLLADGGLWLNLSHEHRALVGPEAYASPALKAVAGIVLGIGSAGSLPDLEAVLRATEDSSVHDAAVQLERRIQTETEGSRIREHFDATLKRVAAERAGRSAHAAGLYAEPKPEGDELAERLAALRLKAAAGPRVVVPRPSPGA